MASLKNKKVGKRAKATGATLEKEFKATNRRQFLRFCLILLGKIIERIIIILIIGSILYGVGYVGFQLLE